jgi:WD40 repeat protein
VQAAAKDKEDAAESDSPILLHDLLYDYACYLAPDRKALHESLLAAYRRKCRDGQWPTGPNDGYFLQNLVSHLIEAGRGQELADLLLKFHWLQIKTDAKLVFDLQHEYADAVVAAPDHPCVRLLALLRRALCRDASTIARHPGLLLQTLWHTCYWHDSPKTAEHCVWKNPSDAESLGWPWNHAGPKLCDLVLEWVQQAKKGGLIHPWLKSSRPGGAMLNSPLEAVLRGHEGEVSSVAVTLDGRRIITGSYDKTVRVWDTKSGREIAALHGHEGEVMSVAITPDGRRIISGSFDKTVRVWEAESGREIAVLRGHEGQVMSVAVTPDDRRIISGSDDKTVRVWEAESGREIAILRGHEGWVRSVAATLDGGRIISGSSDETVRVWEAESGREIAVLRGHERGITSVAVTSDGRRIISGSFDKAVRVWEADSGREIAILRGHEDRVANVAVTSDGRRIVSGSWDKTVRVWDAESGREMAVLRGHESGVTSVAATPDGRLISGSWDKTVRVWETESGREIAILRGHDGWVMSVAITPDGRRILSKDASGQMLEWNMKPPFTSQSPEPATPSVLSWPGGLVNICDTGDYAAVLLGNDVIPCKVERPGSPTAHSVERIPPPE